MQRLKICGMLLLVLVFSGCSTGRDSIEEASRWCGARVTQSNENGLLMRLAQRHATSMSIRDRLDHDSFADRARQIGPSPQEICAEAENWAEAFNNWRQSGQHWNVASKKHRNYGYGRDGRYFCIIVVD
jgi:hypothetical protein